ncbi:MAG: PD40 domain-containing protein [Anaerolineae bacterium]|nr:PD40 domain-containing protein [Anaerolineae bacterium]
MLLRAYRLSDKLGIILLKLIAGLTEQTLSGLLILRRGVVGILRLLVAPIDWLFSRVFRLSGRASNVMVRGAVGAAQTQMARRAARREIDKTVVEDPLRAQNRRLSLLAVALLAALVGVVLWATNPARTPPALPMINIDQAAGSLGETPQATAPNAVAALPTQVPTATALPPVLAVRGTIAFTVRENGQTDIWGLPIGSRNPIRLVADPTDDRDPAWSPDGRRLAFASHRDGNWEIYIQDFIDNSITRMTYDLSFQAAPNWSPDGQWLVYESYLGNTLDLWYVRVDGSQPPAVLPGMSSAPDFSPAWSPDGRRIAFTSWRDGNQEIYLFNLNDQELVNVTNTPLRNEDYPSWSPDGAQLAFSAFDEGIEKVFVLDVDTPGAVAQVVAGGRAPAWSPDGSSLVYATDSVASQQTNLIAAPITDPGLITSIVPAPLGASDPAWTGQPLPPAVINAGAQRVLFQPLYNEQEAPRNADPAYTLRSLPSVEAPYAALSERVNDSFNALREATAERVGWDFLSTLQDAFWDINRLPEPGEERRNWLMTGRAFGINRNAIVGFPAPIEVAREDIGINTYWRIFVRVADSAQNGDLGEPLRRMPWDFQAREQRDVQAYDEGGRLRQQMPEGYYVDFTQLALDYGWERMPAGSDWRANINAVNYWMFRKTDGLDWFTAMREIYTEGSLINFAPTAAPTQPGLTAATLTALPPTPEGSN